MSQKMRGEEAVIKISVDGIQQSGTMIKVTDFTATPRTDINEDDYLGEAETDLDIQHHGWDGGSPSTTKTLLRSISSKRSSSESKTTRRIRPSRSP